MRAWKWTSPIDVPDDALVSSVRVMFSPRHAHIGVWNRGGYAGELTIERRDWPAFVQLLAPLDELERERIEELCRAR